MERNIVLNRIRCPDGTILISRYNHDFVQHVQADGRTYGVDGGCESLHRSYSDRDWEELPVYSDATHEEIRQGFYWGSYGPDGEQPLQFAPLCELTTEHIESILRTQKQLPEWRLAIFLNELEFRRASKCTET